MLRWLLKTILWGCYMSKRWHPFKNQPLFQVVSPDKHKYSIHSDGNIEGFPENSYILNYIPIYRFDTIREYGCISLKTVKLHLLFREIFLRFLLMVYRILLPQFLKEFYSYIKQHKGKNKNIVQKNKGGL